jgi:hypothetical protein
LSTSSSQCPTDFRPSLMPMGAQLIGENCWLEKKKKKELLILHYFGVFIFYLIISLTSHYI